jgi:hypothetical protein
MNEKEKREREREREEDKKCDAAVWLVFGRGAAPG